MEDIIVITSDDLTTPEVDMELRRQEATKRMSDHQENVISNTPERLKMGQKRGFWRKTFVYMPIFAIFAAVLAWGIGEIPLQIANNAEKEFRKEFREFVLDSYQKESSDDYEYGWYERQTKLRERRERIRERIEDKAIEVREKRENSQYFWFCIIGAVFAVMLSIAEPVVSGNGRRAFLNIGVGLLIGIATGYLIAMFINDIYRALGGGEIREDPLAIEQIIARSVGWSIFGGLASIAPGILMRNWKKIILGIFGGLIGGFVGGVCFDVIGFKIEESGLFAEIFDDVAVIPRAIGIVSIFLFSALATAFLENVAKKGWLKVATGVITGKQFILYRNPTIIGSSPRCEIYLFKDPAIAPNHASINSYDGRFILTALNNATVHVNGVAVKQCNLKSGDQIRIGDTVFFFESRTERS